jgi:hypothetical protein
MTLSSQKIYLGELNNTPLGDLRLAASDLGLLPLNGQTLNSSCIHTYSA